MCATKILLQAGDFCGRRRGHGALPGVPDGGAPRGCRLPEKKAGDVVTTAVHDLYNAAETRLSEGCK